MKKTALFLSIGIILTLATTSCKKSQPSYKMEGTFSGHFQGVYGGNDTIVNEGYQVLVTATDKSTATIEGSLFPTLTVLVTKNGINVELVSPTDGITNFLYEGETRTLTFNYSLDDNIANYVGTKPE